MLLCDSLILLYQEFVTRMPRELGRPLPKCFRAGARITPVFATGWRPLPQGQPRCRTTHGKNLCPLGSLAACFSTLRLLLSFSRQPHPPSQCLRVSSGSTEVDGSSEELTA